MNKNMTTSISRTKRNEMRGFYGAIVKLQEAATRFRASRGHGYGRAYSYYIRH